MRAWLLPLIAASLLAAGCAPLTYSPDPRALKDAELVARVKTALLNASGIDAKGIDVRAAGGVVTLEGEVPGSDHERKAIELVRQLPGVAGVTSKLAISRVPRPTTARS